MENKSRTQTKGRSQFGILEAIDAVFNPELDKLVGAYQRSSQRKKAIHAANPHTLSEARSGPGRRPEYHDLYQRIWELYMLKEDQLLDKLRIRDSTGSLTRIRKILVHAEVYHSQPAKLKRYIGSRSKDQINVYQQVLKYITETLRTIIERRGSDWERRFSTKGNIHWDQIPLYGFNPNRLFDFLWGLDSRSAYVELALLHLRLKTGHYLLGVRDTEHKVRVFKEEVGQLLQEQGEGIRVRDFIIQSRRLIIMVKQYWARLDTEEQGLPLWSGKLCDFIKKEILTPYLEQSPRVNVKTFARVIYQQWRFQFVWDFEHCLNYVYSLRSTTKSERRQNSNRSVTPFTTKVTLLP